MKRLIYLIYYLKKLDWQQLWRFTSYVCQRYQIPRIHLLFDVIVSSLIYNISLLEYFQFNFYLLNRDERKKYAGTGYMYEYQLYMNPVKSRVILDDKREFRKNYSEFIHHIVAEREELGTDSQLKLSILKNNGEKVVLKVYNGKCGQNILIKSVDDFKDQDLYDFMLANKFDLAEEFILQHHTLMELSPTAVNTVRIFTQITSQGQVEILGCRLRIAINSSVDNMAAGNIAAPIDENTGIINGPAVFSDITKNELTIHPLTGISILGLQIPYWNETMELVKKAALAHPKNRSVGWDIAITELGPDLIEGNHDWCKLVWQLPVKQGLKPILEEHLSEYKKLKNK